MGAREALPDAATGVETVGQVGDKGVVGPLRLTDGDTQELYNLGSRAAECTGGGIACVDLHLDGVRAGTEIGKHRASSHHGRAAAGGKRALQRDVYGRAGAVDLHTQGQYGEGGRCYGDASVYRYLDQLGTTRHRKALVGAYVCPVGGGNADAVGDIGTCRIIQNEGGGAA